MPHDGSAPMTDSPVLKDLLAVTGDAVPAAEELLDKEIPVLDKGFVRLVDYSDRNKRSGGRHFAYQFFLIKDFVDATDRIKCVDL